MADSKDYNQNLLHAVGPLLDTWGVHPLKQPAAAGGSNAAQNAKPTPTVKVDPKPEPKKTNVESKDPGFKENQNLYDKQGNLRLSFNAKTGKQTGTPVNTDVKNIQNNNNPGWAKGEQDPVTDAKMEGPYKDLNVAYYKTKQGYDESLLKNETVDYSKSPTIKLSGGKDPGIKVPTQLIKDVVASAKKNGVDPYEALAQVSEESSFGHDTGIYKPAALPDNQTTRVAIMQAMNLDEPHRPQSVEQFLDSKGVPGIKSKPDKIEGHTYSVGDEAKVNDYLKKHPEIMKDYQEHLSQRAKVPEGYNTYDSAFKRDKTGIQNYNPSPKYAQNLKKYAAQFKGDKSIQEIVDSVK